MSMPQPPEDGNENSDETPIFKLAYSSEQGRIEDDEPQDGEFDHRKYIDDDWTGEPTERTWLIDELIPDNRITLLSGKGGLGKSMLALQLGVAVAEGDADVLPGSGLVNEHGPRSVVYLTYEEERAEVLRRVRQLGGDDVAERIGNRLVRFDGAAAGELWHPDPDGSGHTSTTGKAAKAMHAVIHVCEERNAALLIIDTVGHAFLSNENDRGIVNEFLRYLDHWARETNTAVVIVAHPPKSSNERYSGNSTWHGTVRALLALEMAVLVKGGKGEEDTRHPALVLDKSNYGMPRHNFPQWWLARGTDGKYPPGKIRAVDKDAAIAMVAAMPAASPSTYDEDAPGF